MGGENGFGGPNSTFIDSSTAQKVQVSNETVNITVGCAKGLLQRNYFLFFGHGLLAFSFNMLFIERSVDIYCKLAATRRRREQ